MRIAAALAGLRIGLFGVGQFAAEAMDLALLVERVARVAASRVRHIRADARRASSNASDHAPPSCMISER